MFNVSEVQSTVTNDRYGFTLELLSYINDAEAPEPNYETLKLILENAYSTLDEENLKIIQNALSLIYQINLANPLSNAALRQNDHVILKMRNAIEEVWLKHEFQNIVDDSSALGSDKYSSKLIELWKGHHASHHEIFDFLENEATIEQIYLFFKSDSALNLIFFDLVAYTLIGAEPATRGTISENLWDEIGHGDNVFTHVNLYKHVLDRRDIILPENHYINMYGSDALAGHNAFMLGAVNRKHYYKLLGVMAMTEVLDPPQYTKLVNGCRRLGLADKDVHYYTEHITIDIKHGDDWLYNVIDLIAEKYPGAKSEFYFGCVLRLQTAERYYDNLLCEMKKLSSL
ncbi:iron-containing redox enzyme family protein [Salmonella enterica subsp. houtenae]|uniref:Iron-containing redox enzyme family protein n=1 Tax=Salmonella houtenae TaxID=59205 RepID=A0A5Y2SEU4_SALHO|nr:iron-containing redox enzyme family protein [Salmonella enterica subsp. houtenae]QKT20658.1 iron-containing redox enzyme family protein [Salmonella enterica]